MVWVFIPDSVPVKEKGIKKPAYGNLKKLIKRPVIWYHSIIVLCAYAGYKTTDDFSLYASDAFGYDEVESAMIGTVSFWMRPVAAVAAGFLADRYKPTLLISISFVLMLVGAIFLGTDILRAEMYWSFLLVISTVSAGIYGVRGIYFALYQEAKIPLVVTGSAVGLVSIIGFTPDVFMGPLMGYLIDSSPGATGHQHVFLVLALFAVIGLAATLAFKLSPKFKK